MTTRRDKLKIRSCVLRAIRDFFHADGYLEVDTPLLLPTVAPEEHIVPFEIVLGQDGLPPTTVAAIPSQQGLRRWYLATSPELEMKRLVAAGHDRIFQITRSFRSGESGRRHSPEFTILEWYRPGTSIHDLVSDLQRLFLHIRTSMLGIIGRTRKASVILSEAKDLCAGVHCRRRGRSRKASVILSGVGPQAELPGNDHLPLSEEPLVALEPLVYRGHPISLAPPWPTTTVREAFLNYAHASAAALSPSDFDLLLVDKVEPNLGRGRPEALHAYPAALGSLAKLDPADPTVAQRMELYVEGMELANGFVELNDPVEQRARFECARAAIAASGRTPPPMPEEYLACLPDLPDTVGIALGIDRLVMLFSDAADISEVLPFRIEP